MLSGDDGKMAALCLVATSLVPDCMYQNLIAVLEGLVGHRDDTFAQVKEQVGVIGAAHRRTSALLR